MVAVSLQLVMRPSSLGGGRILRRTLSVCLSVRPVSGCTLFTFPPSYERTSKIEKLWFSLMGQRHVCTFRHVQRAAYRTAISAAQILVVITLKLSSLTLAVKTVMRTSCRWAAATICPRPSPPSVGAEALEHKHR